MFKIVLVSIKGRQSSHMKILTHDLKLEDVDFVDRIQEIVLKPETNGSMKKREREASMVA